MPSELRQSSLPLGDVEYSFAGAASDSTLLGLFPRNGVVLAIEIPAAQNLQTSWPAFRPFGYELEQDVIIAIAAAIRPMHATD